MKDTHPPLASHPLADVAVEAYLAGVSGVDPTVLVRHAVRQGLLDDWFEDREKPKRIHVLALGKAAPRMLWGLVEASVPFVGLGVAPPGVLAPKVDTFRWLAGEHPIPGPQSFQSGADVQAWIANLPSDAPLLVLLSGGASACVEVAENGDEAGLVAAWKTWLAQGLPMEELNQRRATLSAVKGGKLAVLAHKRTRRIRVWLLADTPPENAPAVVGSGPFHHADVPHRVLASNDDMVVGAGLRLGAMGYSVYRHAPRLDGRVEDDVAAFMAAFHALPGKQVALVGGGESRVVLPLAAPVGGRCHHAALAAARLLRPGEVFASLASDGQDGNTGDAGAWVIAGDADEGALKRFRARPALKAKGRTVSTGASGTNVNDLWVAIRG